MHSTAPRMNMQRLAGRGVHRSWGVRARVRTSTTALALWLACALLLAPLLSRLHQTLHPGHGHAVWVTQTSTLPAVAAAHASSERSVWERLFGAHADGSSVCQLLDHGSTPQGAGPQAHAVVFDVPMPWRAAPPSATWAAGPAAFFQARGPPAFL